MKKIVLSALLRPSKEGVAAKVAEFPDIKVTTFKKNLRWAFTTGSVTLALALGYLPPSYGSSHLISRSPMIKTL
jgi:hypothetical protein